MIRFALHKVWMRDNAVKLILLFLFSWISKAIAQSPEATTLDLTESGRSYLEAVGRRVDSDIVYYNPNLAAPELTTREQPSARESDDAGASWPVSRHVRHSDSGGRALAYLAVRRPGCGFALVPPKRCRARYAYD